MTRRRVALAVALAAVLFVGGALVGTAGAQTTTAPDCSTVGYDGAGTASNPYQVENVSQLQCLNQSLSADYVQAADIDASGTDQWNGNSGFEPVGNLSNPFLGTFEGAGYRITGLTIDRPNESYVGLFGRLDGSTVSNVSLVGVNVTGNGQVGGLAGDLVGSGTVTSSSVTGTVTGGDSNVGGLVGRSFETITESYAAGEVNGPDAGRVGGLVGFSNGGTINSSYATANASSSGTTGGLVGENSGTIHSSYATGAVSGQFAVGGLVGSNSGTVTDSYWDVNTTGQSTSVAGTGLTTSQLKANTSLAGFDFQNTWDVLAGATVSYPFLQNNTQQPAPGREQLYAGGSGTANDPYEIATWAHLNNTRQNLDANFELVTDLTRATPGYNDVAGPTANGGAGFAPLARDTDPSDSGHQGTQFTGTFEGASFTISNLTIDRPNEDYVGLFGIVRAGGAVRNVSVIDANITASEFVGAVAGLNTGTLRASSATGTVSGSDSVGGLVGSNFDGGIGPVTVTESYAAVTVSGDSEVGGLVGDNSGAVESSYATGTVSGSSDVGGLVGDNSGTVRESYAAGAVSGSGSGGGLVSLNSGTVTDSYWDVNTTGQTSSAGGTGLTTSQLQGNASLAGFDFQTTWDVFTLGTDSVRSYPFLRNNTQSPAPGAELYAGGSGTAANPYEIATWYHLNNTRQNLGANFTLVADLNQSTAGYGDVAGPTANLGKGFAPVGDFPSVTRFTGTFEGGDHTISNLTVDRPSEFDVGLFGVVGGDGTIANTSVVDVNLTGDDFVGGLAGTTVGNATIRGSSATGTVTGNDTVGGFVGLNFGNGEVRESSARVNVSGDGLVGGFVGQNDETGTVVASSATGNVSGSTQVGGFVGSNSGTGTVTESSATGPVSGSIQTGGFVGDNTGTVAESYATGTVSGSNLVGGFAGLNRDDGSVDASYATGAVSGNDTVGGFVGLNGETRNATINASYAVGAVSGNFTVGGFAGNNTGAVTDGYWDRNTTGQSVGITDGTGDVTGLTTSQFKANASLAGFDFQTTWDVLTAGSDDALSYPFLRNNTQSPAPGLERLPVLSVGSFASEFPDAVVGTDYGMVEIPVAETNDVQTENLTVTLDIAGAGQTFTFTATNDTAELQNETQQFPFDVGVINQADTYTATVTVDADNAGSATATTTFSVEEPPISNLSDLDVAGQGADATITEGVNESVAVNVTNVGGQAGSFGVTLEIGTAVAETRTIGSLPAGTSEVLAFENVTGGLAPGDYAVNLTTANDTVTGTLTVQQPATSSLSALDIAGQGTDATITATANESVAVNVTNVGDQSGSFAVTLSIGAGVLVTESTGTLAGGATEQLVFENVTGGLSAGEYDVTTTTVDDTLAGNLTVGAPATPSVSALDIAGQGVDATVVVGTNESVAVNVTNTGDSGGTFTISLAIANSTTTQLTRTQSVTVGAGATTQVAFKNATGAVPIGGLGPAGGYDVTVTAGQSEANGTLTVSVDVNGDGTPARDTTGDGLLNDANGNGDFRVFDVQTLFTNLANPVVQDNAELFNFQGQTPDEVRIFDVQALFEKL